MKLNVTIDLDWLDEDGNIDDVVKDSIINGVRNAISRDCLAKVEKESSTKINEAINESIEKVTQAIEQKAIKFADDWLTKEVSITNKWGDVVETVNIEGLIKKSFDQTLDRKVDSNGNFSGSYGNKCLLDYLVDDKVKKLVGDKIKDLGRGIDKQIEVLVTEGIKANVANKFAEMVVQTAKSNYQQLENKGS